MSEKRFTKCDTKIRDNGEEMTQAEVCDMLNKLHDENEQLKKAMTNEYNSANMVTVLKTEVNDLTKENKELKQELGKLAEFNQKAIW